MRCSVVTPDPSPYPLLKCSILVFCTQADPGLSKAELRAGIAHWRLGNMEAAIQRVETACGMPGAPPEASATRKELAAFQDRKAKVPSDLRCQDRQLIIQPAEYSQSSG